ncbi:alpha/beta hydrolase [Nitrosomonas sp.]|uniref:alpha/beta hydrolase n=1 Tax=Nitrosomonas sp. TaxID=42353 RepID=UPI001DA3C8D8|nr:alpha/beta fold hydrolase [Nitrosomonas sp.]MCB1949178.1 alpha/beta fold hydrolase [Nitrosomonas sp.]MCP5242476.1 alpha/beta fold hydrolase [Burkholderiales bacterium]MDR4515301.1 alpha/beta fold hydrolase [Nitrosomonas sp.]
MFRRIWIYLAGVIVFLMIVSFLAGELVTGSAATATETLLTDLPVESVCIPTEDGMNVRGWLVNGEQGGGAVLLVHSIRSNRVEMLSRARFLTAHGYHVLMIDLQAHGETPGSRITFGALESKNVESAINFLRRTYPNERIGAIGVSLGAAAIVLAKQNTRLSAVVLESLHPTIEEAVENRLRLFLGEPGSLLLPLLLAQIAFFTDTQIDELSPIKRINNLSSPVLLISGTDDKHTTPPETERLFVAAREPKELWIVPGAGHFNMHEYAGKTYEREVLGFLSYYLRPSKSHTFEN